MVKKGTKRKTRWRTLSIGDGATDDPTAETALPQQLCSRSKEQKENFATTPSTRHPTNGLFLKTTINDPSKGITQPSRSDHSRPFYKSSDKYPSSKHPNSTTSYSLYKRRTSYQSASSKYRPSVGDRSYTRSSDTNNCDKDNGTTKPLFNEDEYTRITTPRQDVLFKKGYLSRPKKIQTVANDIKTSSSGAMSVTSTEESMSSSTQSVSPEYSNSTPELNTDTDQSYFYPGFFDQNGVFFVNPYISNGFDPYGGQLIMMPYDGPPYSINPAEYYSHDTTQSPYTLLQNQQKRNSIDSQTTPTTASSHDDQSTSASSPPVTEQSDSGDVNADSQSTTKSDENSSNVGNISSGMIPDNCQHPQLFYPFMYGPPPQFLPMNGLGFNEHSNGYGVPYNRYNRFKKRKKSTYKHSNSTGVSATTTDYSDDDESTDNEQMHAKPIQHSDDGYESNITPVLQENILSQSTLNTDVSEFVPRRYQLTKFNVDVEEFHPRNYNSSHQDATEHSLITSQITRSNEENQEEKTDKSNNNSTTTPTTVVTSTNQSSNNSKSNRSKTKCMLRSSNSNRISNKGERTVNDEITVKADLVYKTDTSPKHKYKSFDQATNVTKIKTARNMPKILNHQEEKSVAEKKLMIPHESPNNQANQPEIELSNQIADPNQKVEEKAIKENSPIKINKIDDKTDGKLIDKKTLESNNVKAMSINQSSSIIALKYDKKRNEKLSSLSEQKISKRKVSKPVKDLKKDVGKDKETEKNVHQSNQPTYAQMVGPAKNNPPDNDSTNKIKDEIEHPQELIDINRAIEESQRSTDEKKIVWQTVKPKGRKKQHYIKCEEDIWNDHTELEEPIELIKLDQPADKEENVTSPTDTDDNKVEEETEIQEPEVPDNQLKPKTTKKPKQDKVKKSKSKTLPKKTGKDSTILTDTTDALNSPPRSLLQPKKMDATKTADISNTKYNTNKEEEESMDYIDTIINNCDISNFSFETNSSIFVNPMTRGIFVNDRKTISGNTGFAMNNTLMLMNKYDFGKVKESTLLKEEEEMVMKVMKSLTEKEKCEKSDISATDVAKIENDIVDGENAIDKTEDNLDEQLTGEMESVATDEKALVSVDGANSKENGADEDEEDLFFKVVDEMNIKFIEKDNTDAGTKLTNIDSSLDAMVCNGTNHEINKNETITEKIKMLIEDEVCNSSLKNSSNQSSNNDLKLDSFYTNMGNMFKQIKSFEIATKADIEQKMHINHDNGNQQNFLDHNIDIMSLDGLKCNNKGKTNDHNITHLENISNHNKTAPINDRNSKIPTDNLELNQQLIEDAQIVTDDQIECPKIEELNENIKIINNSNNDDDDIDRTLTIEIIDSNELETVIPNQCNKEKIGMINDAEEIASNEDDLLKINEQNEIDDEFITKSTTSLCNYSNNEYIFDASRSDKCIILEGNNEFIDIQSTSPSANQEMTDRNFMNENQPIFDGSDVETDADFNAINKCEDDDDDVIASNEQSDTECTSEMSSEDDGENTVIDQMIDRKTFNVNNTQYCDNEKELNDEYHHAGYVDENSVINASTNQQTVFDCNGTPKQDTSEGETDECHVSNDAYDLFLNSQIESTVELDIFMQKLKTKRTQSPRHSEDSGILEYTEDNKYFSDTDESRQSNTEPIKFPITEAVSKWLHAKQKEKSPEPILRLPTDPILNQQIERSIRKQFNIAEFFSNDGEMSSDSETEYEFKTPIKMVSKHNAMSLNEMNERKRIESDTSDENVSAAAIFDEPDIMECWELDPETRKKRQVDVENQTQKSDKTNDVIEPYESVYGQTIDYANILDTKDELYLSNNILFNDRFNNENNENNANNSSRNTNQTNKLLQTTDIKNNTNDTFSDSTKNKNDLRNLNYVKPPEICCILM